MSKPRIRQQWILDKMKTEQDISYSNLLSTYIEKWRKSNATYSKDWKASKIMHEDYLLRLKNAKEEVSIEHELKELEKGLKTKSERLINLQNLVDNCLSSLASGKTDDVLVRKTDEGGVKLTEFKRKMTVNEINQTRRTMRDLQSEISKIEGDYLIDNQQKAAAFDQKVIFRFPDNNRDKKS